MKKDPILEAAEALRRYGTMRPAADKLGIHHGRGGEGYIC